MVEELSNKLVYHQAFSSYPSKQLPSIPFAVKITPFSLNAIQMYPASQGLARCIECGVHGHPFGRLTELGDNICPYCLCCPYRKLGNIFRALNYQLQLKKQNFPQFDNKLPKMIFLIANNLSLSYFEMIKQSLKQSLIELPSNMQIGLIIYGNNYVKIYTINEQFTQIIINEDILKQKNINFGQITYQNTINNQIKMIQLLDILINQSNNQLISNQNHIKILKFINYLFRSKRTIINIFRNSETNLIKNQLKQNSKIKISPNITINIFLIGQQSKIYQQLHQLTLKSMGYLKLYLPDQDSQLKRIYYDIYDLLANIIGFCGGINIRCTKGWKVKSYSTIKTIIKIDQTINIEIEKDSIYSNNQPEYICLQVALLLLKKNGQRVLQIYNHSIPVLEKTYYKLINKIPLSELLVEQYLNKAINSEKLQEMTEYIKLNVKNIIKTDSQIAGKKQYLNILFTIFNNHQLSIKTQTQWYHIIKNYQNFKILNYWIKIIQIDNNFNQIELNDFNYRKINKNYSYIIHMGQISYIYNRKQLKSLIYKQSNNNQKIENQTQSSVSQESSLDDYSQIIDNINQQHNIIYSQIREITHLSFQKNFDKHGYMYNYIIYRIKSKIFDEKNQKQFIQNCLK